YEIRLSDAEGDHVLHRSGDFEESADTTGRNRTSAMANQLGDIRTCRNLRHGQTAFDFLEYSRFLHGTVGRRRGSPLRSRRIESPTSPYVPNRDHTHKDCMSERFQNYIGGSWVDSSGGDTFESINPARNVDVIGRFPESTPDDVDAAVRAAREAFKSWSRKPAPQRGEILRRIGDLLTQRKDDIAFEMTREMGKPFVETRGDVQEAIDTAYYAASETRRLF